MIVGRAVYNQSMISKQDHDVFKLGIVRLQLWEICVLSVRLWTAEWSLACSDNWCQNNGYAKGE